MLKSENEGNSGQNATNLPSSIISTLQSDCEMKTNKNKKYKKSTLTTAKNPQKITSYVEQQQYQVRKRKKMKNKKKIKEINYT